jgi:hypothetical protein
MACGKININILTLRKYKITIAMLIFLYIGTYRNIDMLDISLRINVRVIRYCRTIYPKHPMTGGLNRTGSNSLSLRSKYEARALLQNSTCQMVHHHRFQPNCGDATRGNRRFGDEGFSSL